ncbi:MAG: universal stress protein [Desulfobacteraceae bacterium]|nr:universal stress protein [Desulfobacteraceae bacterium]
MPVKNILIPVDGSSHATTATEYAIKMACIFQASVVILHCHRSFPVILGEPHNQKVIDKINEKSDELMQSYRTLMDRSEVPYSERILEGPAAATICNTAKNLNCDLIVMGCRGRTTLEGLILGSVTHRVLHAAPCPVLVVR